MNQVLDETSLVSALLLVVRAAFVGDADVASDADTYVVVHAAPVVFWVAVAVVVNDVGAGEDAAQYVAISVSVSVSIARAVVFGYFFEELVAVLPLVELVFRQLCAENVHEVCCSYYIRSSTCLLFVLQKISQQHQVQKFPAHSYMS